MKGILTEKQNFGVVMPVKSKSRRKMVEIDEYFQELTQKKYLTFDLNRSFPTLKELF